MMNSHSVEHIIGRPVSAYVLVYVAIAWRIGSTSIQ